MTMTDRKSWAQLTTLLTAVMPHLLMGTTIRAEVTANQADGGMIRDSERHLAINDPDQFAWILFSRINQPIPNNADGRVIWEGWALARDVFADPDNAPKWPDQVEATRVKKFESIPLQQQIRRQEAAAAGMKIAEFDPLAAAGQSNETRMNKATFDFIVKENLYHLEGQEAFFGTGQSMQFPLDAMEIKAQWRRIDPQSAGKYHTAETSSEGGAKQLWGLTALHITTKDLPNWFWATFEHKNNVGREGVIPSRDRHGLPSDLQGTKWENYVLRGTQVDFVDASGRPTILGNSQIEQGFQQTSSCITCHARATIGDPDRGSPSANRMTVFNENGEGFIGIPNPDWFANNDRTPAARNYGQQDFVYSLRRARRRTAERSVVSAPVPESAAFVADLSHARFAATTASFLQPTISLATDDVEIGVRFTPFQRPGWEEIAERRGDFAGFAVPRDFFINPNKLQDFGELVMLPPIESYFFGVPETVCAPDDRMQVPDPSTPPFNANCQLIINLPTGEQALGTGWLMGPKLVVTAGHCIHEGMDGSYFSEIEIIPGMNGPSRPFGSQISRTFRAAPEWASLGSVAHDYGAIILDQPFQSATGASPALHRTMVATDAQLNSAMVSLAGYPADQPFGSQWIDHDPISQIRPTRFRYMLDTFGGQSGSAVILQNVDRAVGIHNYGGCPNNCTRITAEVQARLDLWWEESNR